MAVLTVQSVEIISSTTVRLEVTGMQVGVVYNVEVSEEIESLSGRLIDPAYNAADFTGDGTIPQLLSVVLVDALHIDLVFSKPMIDDPILLYPTNYTVTGDMDSGTTLVERNEAGDGVRLTLADPLLYGDYRVALDNCPDTDGNLVPPENAEMDFSSVRENPVSDLVTMLTDNTDECLIEVRAIGIMVDGVYPEIALRLFGEEVVRWSDVRGKVEYYQAERNGYLHAGKVTPADIQVAYTNDVLGGPEQECLAFWELDAASTVTAAYQYERFDRFRPSAKMTLTAPSAGGDVNRLNALSQDLPEVVVGQTVIISGQVKMLEGVTARVRFTLGTEEGLLVSTLDLEGTGDWESFRLEPLVATLGNTEGRVSLIVVSPDVGSTVAEWRDIRAGLELLENCNFETTIEPWYTHPGSKCFPTLLTEEAGPYGHAELTILETEPSKRFYHSVSFDAYRGKVVLFGGNDGVVKGDTWEYTTATHTWAKITPATTSPSARGLHAACYDSLRHRVIISGGQDSGGGHLQDLWAWDGVDWTDITPVGTKPGARRAHAIAYDSNRDVIMLFGGVASVKNNETWEYNCATGLWAEIFPVAGIKPSPRQYHTMEYDTVKRRLVLFGGRTETNHSDETWEYNGGIQSWALMTIAGDKPTARDEHKMAYDSVRRRMLIFGGNDGAYSATSFDDETWEYDSATVSWSMVQGGGDPGGSNPMGRVAFGMTYDSIAQRSVLFGGWTGAIRNNETWEFSGSTTSWALHYTGYDPLNYGSSHWNSILQAPGEIPDGSQIRLRGKFRAPVDTELRIHVCAIPWTTGVIGAWGPFSGSGDWEDFELADVVVDTDHRDVQIRLAIHLPDATGSWADWKDISLTRNIIRNGTFSDRGALIDAVLIDGKIYETEGAEVLSTGSWLPGDGALPSPGYRQTEVLTNNGYFDFAGVSDEEILDGVDARIDTYRKGNGVISVVNGVGQPVVGVDVTVEQLTHSFLFGSGIFEWYESYVAPGYPPLTEAQQLWSDTWRALFLDVFNFATLPYYWVSGELENGSMLHAANYEALAWCLANGVQAKGHPIFWNADEPAWINNWSDLDAVKARVFGYLEKCIGNSPDMFLWEVANEAAVWDTLGLRQAAPATTRMWMREGQVPLLLELFAAARALIAPGQILSINDYHVDDLYAALLLDLIEGAGGAPFDVIGIQSHMHDDIWSPQKLWQVCDRFASIHPRIHFTEVSILSGYKRNAEGGRIWATNPETTASWPSTPLGEAQQAVEVEKFYKVLFSHPNVEGITWWNNCDGVSWLNAPRGFFAADLTPKPSWAVLKNLIKTTWWTSLSGVTNGAGQYSFRGFAGTYRITVRRGGWVATRDVTLPTTGDSWTIVFDE